MYTVQGARVSKRGYAVQWAYMQSFEGMTRKVAELQQKGIQNILINIEPGKDGNADYKILIGSFGSRSEALAYARQTRRVLGATISKDLNTLP